MQFSSSWEVDSEKANHDYSFKRDNICKTLNIADPESMLNNVCYYYFFFFILENIITLEHFIEQLHLKINLSWFTSILKTICAWSIFILMNTASPKTIFSGWRYKIYAVRSGINPREQMLFLNKFLSFFFIYIIYLKHLGLKHCF